MYWSFLRLLQQPWLGCLVDFLGTVWVRRLCLHLTGHLLHSSERTTLSCHPLIVGTPPSVFSSPFQSSFHIGFLQFCRFCVLVPQGGLSGCMIFFLVSILLLVSAIVRLTTNVLCMGMV